MRTKTNRSGVTVTEAKHSAAMLADAPALWPSPEYERQLSNLRAAVGKQIYIVETRVDDLHLSARFPGRSHELLAVLDYPKPDPSRRLYPHLLVLDDGRGINLGRILRISHLEPYAPASDNVLYEDGKLAGTLLHAERQLSSGRIKLSARRQLGDFVQPRHALPPGSEARLESD